MPLEETICLSRPLWHSSSSQINCPILFFKPGNANIATITSGISEITTIAENTEAAA
ncbi:hypothetical protein SNOG_08579 [Parastagonospora nodorum SN15]|uniref:Uncharacterized protein n=1 Tax=Phaeosphaeria nodorum (strain SN15 / ATCC MYA-4574 / FGSC 10173) TaxID=321614 RepID=Q0UI35_PHANO|nr:hypothetical protein SNOG_08579 [Parastagonospora nodorum SN15]EAT83747.1 hypothetical protein SNOG_08579 [Parastagonospora nodorum SN15]